eukprot:3496663-Rhodomonas_salina.2
MVSLLVEDGDGGDGEDHDVEQDDEDPERMGLPRAGLVRLELDDAVEERDSLDGERGGLHVVDEHIGVGLDVHEVQQQEQRDREPR